MPFVGCQFLWCTAWHNHYQTWWYSATNIKSPYFWPCSTPALIQLFIVSPVRALENTLENCWDANAIRTTRRSSWNLWRRGRSRLHLTACEQPGWKNKFQAPAWNSLNHCMWLMKSSVKEKRVRFGILTVHNLVKCQAASKYLWIKYPPSSKWYFTAYSLVGWWAAHLEQVPDKVLFC